MAIILYCNDPKAQHCTWSGEHDELVALTDDINDEDFSYCPNCEGRDFQEEDDEREDDE